jgi:hypothetical protein
MLAETHIFLILVLLDLIYLFSHDLAVPSRLFFVPFPIHYSIFKIDTIFNHKSNNFLQTVNHELRLCVFLVAFPIAVSIVELTNFLVEFLLQVIKLKSEIVDDLGDLLFDWV